MSTFLSDVPLGDIEDALFRAGACRFECSSLVESIIDSNSIATLQASSLRKRGVFPDILANELRAIGVVVHWDAECCTDSSKPSSRVH